MGRQEEVSTSKSQRLRRVPTGLLNKDYVVLSSQTSEIRAPASHKQKVNREIMTIIVALLKLKGLRFHL